MRTHIARAVGDLIHLLILFLLLPPLRLAVKLDRLRSPHWVTVTRTFRAGDDAGDLEMMLTGTKAVARLWLWSLPDMKAWSVRETMGPLKVATAERFMDADERRLYYGLLEGR